AVWASRPFRSRAASVVVDISISREAGALRPPQLFNLIIEYLNSSCTGESCQAGLPRVPEAGEPPEPCAITLSEGASTESMSVRPVRIPRVFTQQSALIEIGVGA